MGNVQPNSPMINVLLVGMDAKKEAIFRMAFKMHAAGKRYGVADNTISPQLAIVDVDGAQGMSVWHDFKKEQPDLPAILSSVDEPDFAVPYLAKPIKVEVLFPLIQEVLRGGGVFDPVRKQKEREQLKQAKEEKFRDKKKEIVEEDEQFVVRKFQRKEQLPTTRISLFDVESGLLGSLRAVCRQTQDAALIYRDKPILVVFPSIQKILLAVPPEELKKICHEDNVQITTRYIAENPTWRSNAKVSFESCLWQFAIWSAHGRLLTKITPDTMMRMKGWPNLTRLAHIPDAMRLSAFMTQTTTNLHILYKILRVELADLLNFIAANYVIGLLMTDKREIQSVTEAEQDGTVQGNGLQEDGIVVRQKYKSQSTGMLQRLMSRLSVKKEEDN